MKGGAINAIFIQHNSKACQRGLPNRLRCLPYIKGSLFIFEAELSPPPIAAMATRCSNRPFRNLYMLRRWAYCSHSHSRGNRTQAEVNKILIRDGCPSE